MVDVAIVKWIVRELGHEMGKSIPYILNSIFSIANRKELLKLCENDLISIIDTFSDSRIFRHIFCFTSWINLIGHIQEGPLKRKLKNVFFTFFQSSVRRYLDEAEEDNMKEVAVFSVYALLDSHHQESQILQAFEGALNNSDRRGFREENYQIRRSLKIHSLYVKVFMLKIYLEDSVVPHGFHMYAIDDGQRLIWNSNDFIKLSIMTGSRPCYSRERRVYIICDLKPPPSLARKLQNTLASGQILQGL